MRSRTIVLVLATAFIACAPGKTEDRDRKREKSITVKSSKVEVMKDTSLVARLKAQDAFRKKAAESFKDMSPKKMSKIAKAIADLGPENLTPDYVPEDTLNVRSSE